MNLSLQHRCVNRSADRYRMIKPTGNDMFQIRGGQPMFQSGTAPRGTDVQPSAISPIYRAVNPLYAVRIGPLPVAHCQQAVIIVSLSRYRIKRNSLY